MLHRGGTEDAEKTEESFIKMNKPLRTLRLCGEKEFGYLTAEARRTPSKSIRIFS
jgi:hypothetical protein